MLQKDHGEVIQIRISKSVIGDNKIQPLAKEQVDRHEVRKAVVFRLHPGVTSLQESLTRTRDRVLLKEQVHFQVVQKKKGPIRNLKSLLLIKKVPSTRTKNHHSKKVILPAGTERGFLKGKAATHFLENVMSQRGEILPKENSRHENQEAGFRSVNIPEAPKDLLEEKKGMMDEQKVEKSDLINSLPIVGFAREGKRMS